MASSYPFVPKTNARLRPGDFWSIPLVDGSYACGRVLQMPTTRFPSSTVQFLGALMDWHGSTEPDAASLAGAGTLDRGVMHVISITRIGGSVAGNRDLALDGIEPGLFINGTDIQQGYDYAREFRPGDRGRIPEWSWWSWNLIWHFANRRLLGRELPGDAEPADYRR